MVKQSLILKDTPGENKENDHLKKKKHCFFYTFKTIALKWCVYAGIDLIAAFYGCLYAGCIPVTVRPPHPQNLSATLPTVRMIIDVSLCVCIWLCFLLTTW